MPYKRDAFEYIVNKISSWNEEAIGSKTDGLNKLKIIKLHFFICAVTGNKEKNDLLNVFDEFYALPFGHVESDIYNFINRDELRYFSLSKRGFGFKEEVYTPQADLSPIDINLTDEAIEKLKELNPDIIKYSAFDLVELSHKWSSWISIFNYAKSLGKLSEKIPLEIIRDEQKIFSL